jgi:hypothetical protein
MALRVFARPDIAQSMIEEKFGGLRQLVAEWQAKEETSPFPKSKGRSSVSDYLRDGFSAGQDYLAVCSMLDVDPLALLDYERTGFFSKFTLIRSAIYSGFGGRSALRELVDMYGPKTAWPSDGIAQAYYQRTWYAKEFNNLAVAHLDEYARLSFNFDGLRSSHPVAAHIAYKREASRDGLWRYFGVVLRGNEGIRLYSEDGDYQEAKLDQGSDISFRTYFGGRRVIFRAASLHKYSLDIVHPCKREDYVTFKW